MKKIICVFLMLIAACIFSNRSYADINDYQTFAYLNISSGKLLRDYTESELKQEVAKTKNWKFRGWRINLFEKNVDVEFISNSIFSMYNTGSTPMKYSVKVQTENTVKTSVDCTGSIKYSVSGNIKKFKNGLDVALKMDTSYTETTLIKNQEDIDISIDPNTMCVIYIQGHAKLTNGVARYYDLGMTQFKGGFEYFTILDSFLRIEKIAL